MLIYDDNSKNATVYSIRIFAFFKVFKLRSMCVKLQVNQQHFSIQEKVCWRLFYPHSHNRQWLWGQNTPVGIRLIELTQSSDTLNYKPVFKQCILQIILHIFVLFIFLCNKIFFSRNWALFYIIFDLVWGGIRCYSIEGSVFLALFV